MLWGEQGENKRRASVTMAHITTTAFQGQGLSSRKQCPALWDSWTKVQAPKGERGMFVCTLDNKGHL